MYDIGDLSEFPMTIEELDKLHRELLFKIKNDIEVEENQELLFKSVYRLGITNLKKYRNIEEDINELLPLMSIAFMKSIKLYKLDTNNTFIPIFYLSIKSEIINEYYWQLDNQKVLKPKYKNDIHLYIDEEKSNGDTKGNSWERILASEKNTEDNFFEQELINILEDVIESICEVKLCKTDLLGNRKRRKQSTFEKAERNKQMIKEYIFGENTIMELSNKYNLDYSTVRKTINKKLEIIKKQLTKDKYNGII